MTDERIAEIKAMVAKCTPGEWMVNDTAKHTDTDPDAEEVVESPNPGHYICEVFAQYNDENLVSHPARQNADFIAASKSIVTELLDEVEAAQKLEQGYITTIERLNDEVERLRTKLALANKAIDALPEDAFGYNDNGDGNVWPLKDEILYNIKYDNVTEVPDEDE